MRLNEIINSLRVYKNQGVSDEILQDLASIFRRRLESEYKERLAEQKRLEASGALANAESQKLAATEAAAAAEAAAASGAQESGATAAAFSIAESIRTRMEADTKKLSELEAEVKRIEGELADARSKATDTEKALQDATTALTTAAATLQGARAFNKELIQDISGYKLLEGQLPALTAAESGATADYSTKKADVAAAQATVAQKQTEYNAAVTKKADLDAEIAHLILLTKSDSAKSAWDAALEKYRTAKKLREDLDADESSLATIEAQLTALVGTFDAADSRLKTANEVVKDLSTEIKTQKDLRGKSQEEKADFDDDTGALAELEKTLGGLEADLATKRKELEDAINECKDIFPKFAAAKDAASDAEGRVTRFKELRDQIFQIIGGIYSATEAVNTEWKAREAARQTRDNPEAFYQTAQSILTGLQGGKSTFDRAYATYSAAVQEYAVAKKAADDAFAEMVELLEGVQARSAAYYEWKGAELNLRDLEAKMAENEAVVRGIFAGGIHPQLDAFINGGNGPFTVPSSSTTFKEKRDRLQACYDAYRAQEADFNTIIQGTEFTKQADELITNPDAPADAYIAARDRLVAGGFLTLGADTTTTSHTWALVGAATYNDIISTTDYTGTSTAIAYAAGVTLEQVFTWIKPTIPLLDEMIDLIDQGRTTAAAAALETQNTTLAATTAIPPALDRLYTMSGTSKDRISEFVSPSLNLLITNKVSELKMTIDLAMHVESEKIDAAKAAVTAFTPSVQELRTAIQSIRTEKGIEILNGAAPKWREVAPATAPAREAPAPQTGGQAAATTDKPLQLSELYGADGKMTGSVATKLQNLMDPLELSAGIVEKPYNMTIWESASEASGKFLYDIAMVEKQRQHPFATPGSLWLDAFKPDIMINGRDIICNTAATASANTATKRVVSKDTFSGPCFLTCKIDAIPASDIWIGINSNVAQTTGSPDITTNQTHTHLNILTSFINTRTAAGASTQRMVFLGQLEITIIFDGQSLHFYSDGLRIFSEAVAVAQRDTTAQSNRFFLFAKNQNARIYDIYMGALPRRSNFEEYAFDIAKAEINRQAIFDPKPRFDDLWLIDISGTTVGTPVFGAPSFMDTYTGTNHRDARNVNLGRTNSSLFISNGLFTKRAFGTMPSFFRFRLGVTTQEIYFVLGSGFRHSREDISTLNGNYTRFRFRINNGTITQENISPASINIGTYTPTSEFIIINDGTNMKLYVDGKLLSTMASALTDRYMVLSNINWFGDTTNRPTVPIRDIYFGELSTSVMEDIGALEKMKQPATVPFADMWNTNTTHLGTSSIPSNGRSFVVPTGSAAWTSTTCPRLISSTTVPSSAWFFTFKVRMVAAAVFRAGITEHHTETGVDTLTNYMNHTLRYNNGYAIQIPSFTTTVTNVAGTVSTTQLADEIMIVSDGGRMYFFINRRLFYISPNVVHTSNMRFFIACQNADTRFSEIHYGALPTPYAADDFYRAVSSEVDKQRALTTQPSFNDMWLSPTSNPDIPIAANRATAGSGRGTITIRNNTSFGNWVTNQRLVSRQVFPGPCFLQFTLNVRSTTTATNTLFAAGLHQNLTGIQDPATALMAINPQILFNRSSLQIREARDGGSGATRTINSSQVLTAGDFSGTVTYINDGNRIYIYFNTNLVYTGAAINNPLNRFFLIGVLAGVTVSNIFMGDLSPIVSSSGLKPMTKQVLTAAAMYGGAATTTGLGTDITRVISERNFARLKGLRDLYYEPYQRKINAIQAWYSKAVSSIPALNNEIQTAYNSGGDAFKVYCFGLTSTLTPVGYNRNFTVYDIYLNSDGSVRATNISYRNDTAIQNFNINNVTNTSFPLSTNFSLDSKLTELNNHINNFHTNAQTLKTAYFGLKDLGITPPATLNGTVTIPSDNTRAITFANTLGTTAGSGYTYNTTTRVLTLLNNAASTLLPSGIATTIVNTTTSASVWVKLDERKRFNSAGAIISTNVTGTSSTILSRNTINTGPTTMTLPQRFETLQRWYDALLLIKDRMARIQAIRGYIHPLLKDSLLAYPSTGTQRYYPTFVIPNTTTTTNDAVYTALNGKTLASFQTTLDSIFALPTLPALTTNTQIETNLQALLTFINEKLISYIRPALKDNTALVPANRETISLPSETNTTYSNTIDYLNDYNASMKAKVEEATVTFNQKDAAYKAAVQTQSTARGQLTTALESLRTNLGVETSTDELPPFTKTPGEQELPAALDPSVLTFGGQTMAQILTSLETAVTQANTTLEGLKPGAEALETTLAAEGGDGGTSKLVAYNTVRESLLKEYGNKLTLLNKIVTKYAPFLERPAVAASKEFAAAPAAAAPAMPPPSQEGGATGPTPCDVEVLAATGPAAEFATLQAKVDEIKAAYGTFFEQINALILSLEGQLGGWEEEQGIAQAAYTIAETAKKAKEGEKTGLVEKISATYTPSKEAVREAEVTANNEANAAETVYTQEKKVADDAPKAIAADNAVAKIQAILAAYGGAAATVEPTAAEPAAQVGGQDAAAAEPAAAEPAAAEPAATNSSGQIPMEIEAIRSLLVQAEKDKKDALDAAKAALATLEQEEAQGATGASSAADRLTTLRNQLHSALKDLILKYGQEVTKTATGVDPLPADLASIEVGQTQAALRLVNPAEPDPELGTPILSTVQAATIAKAAADATLTEKQGADTEADDAVRKKVAELSTAEGAVKDKKDAIQSTYDGKTYEQIEAEAAAAAAAAASGAATAQQLSLLRNTARGQLQDAEASATRLQQLLAAAQARESGAEAELAAKEAAEREFLAKESGAVSATLGSELERLRLKEDEERSAAIQASAAIYESQALFSTERLQLIRSLSDARTKEQEKSDALFALEEKVRTARLEVEDEETKETALAAKLEATLQELTAATASSAPAEAIEEIEKSRDEIAEKLKDVRAYLASAREKLAEREKDASGARTELESQAASRSTAETALEGQLRQAIDTLKIQLQAIEQSIDRTEGAIETARATRTEFEGKLADARSKKAVATGTSLELLEIAEANYAGRVTSASESLRIAEYSLSRLQTSKEQISAEIAAIEEYLAAAEAEEATGAVVRASGAAAAEERRLALLDQIGSIESSAQVAAAAAAAEIVARLRAIVAEQEDIRAQSGAVMTAAEAEAQRLRELALEESGAALREFEALTASQAKIAGDRAEKVATLRAAWSLESSRREQLATLLSTTATAKRTLEAVRASRTRAEARRAVADEELTKAREADAPEEAIATLQGELATLKKEVDGLDDEIKAKSSELSDFEDDVKKLQDQLDEIVKARDAAEEAVLGQINEAMTILRTQISTIEAGLTSTASAIGEFESEQASLLRQLQTLQTDAQGATGPTLQRLRIQESELSYKLSSAGESLAMARQSQARLQKSKATLEEELSALEAYLAEAQAEEATGAAVVASGATALSLQQAALLEELQAADSGARAEALALSSELAARLRAIVAEQEQIRTESGAVVQKEAEELLRLQGLLLAEQQAAIEEAQALQASQAATSTRRAGLLQSLSEARIEEDRLRAELVQLQSDLVDGRLALQAARGERDAILERQGSARDILDGARASNAPEVAIKELEKTLDSIGEELTTAEGVIADAAEVVSGLETSEKGKRQQLEELEGARRAAEQLLKGAIEEAIGAIDVQLQTMAAAAASTKEAIAAHVKEMETLEETLKQLRADEPVAASGADQQRLRIKILALEVNIRSAKEDTRIANETLARLLSSEQFLKAERENLVNYLEEAQREAERVAGEVASGAMAEESRAFTAAAVLLERETAARAVAASGAAALAEQLRAIIAEQEQIRAESGAIVSGAIAEQERLEAVRLAEQAEALRESQTFLAAQAAIADQRIALAEALKAAQDAEEKKLAEIRENDLVLDAANQKQEDLEGQETQLLAKRAAAEGALLEEGLPAEAVKSIREEIDGLNGRLADLSGGLAEARSATKAAEEVQARLDGELEGLEAARVKADADLREKVQESALTLGVQVTSIEKSLQDLSGSLGVVIARQAELRGSLEGVDASIGSTSPGPALQRLELQRAALQMQLDSAVEEESLLRQTIGRLEASKAAIVAEVAVLTKYLEEAAAAKEALEAQRASGALDGAQRRAALLEMVRAAESQAQVAASGAVADILTKLKAIVEEQRAIESEAAAIQSGAEAERQRLRALQLEREAAALEKSKSLYESQAQLSANHVELSNALLEARRLETEKREALAAAVIALEEAKKEAFEARKAYLQVEVTLAMAKESLDAAVANGEPPLAIQEFERRVGELTSSFANATEVLNGANGVVTEKQKAVDTIEEELKALIAARDTAEVLLEDQLTSAAKILSAQKEAITTSIKGTETEIEEAKAAIEGLEAAMTAGRVEATASGATGAVAQRAQLQITDLEAKLEAERERLRIAEGALERLKAVEAQIDAEIGSFMKYLKAAEELEAELELLAESGASATRERLAGFLSTLEEAETGAKLAADAAAKELSQQLQGILEEQRGIIEESKAIVAFRTVEEARLEALKEAAEKERLQESAARVAAAAAYEGELRAAMEGAAAAAEAVEANAAAITKVQGELEAVVVKIAEEQAMITRLEAEIRAIEKVAAELPADSSSGARAIASGEIEERRTEIAKLQASIAGSESMKKGALEQLEALLVASGDLKAALVEATAAVEKEKAEELQRLHTESSSLEGALSTVRSKLEELRAQEGALQEKMVALESGAQTQKSALELERIQAELKSVRESIGLFSTQEGEIVTQKGIVNRAMEDMKSITTVEATGAVMATGAVGVEEAGRLLEAFTQKLDTVKKEAEAKTVVDTGSIEKTVAAQVASNIKKEESARMTQESVERMRQAEQEGRIRSALEVAERPENFYSGLENIAQVVPSRAYGETGYGEAAYGEAAYGEPAEEEGAVAEEEPAEEEEQPTENSEVVNADNILQQMNESQQMGGRHYRRKTQRQRNRKTRRRRRSHKRLNSNK